MSSLQNSYSEITSPRENKTLVSSGGGQTNYGDHISQISRAHTVLNELRIEQRTPIFSLNAIYPLSIFRDVVPVGTVNFNVDRYDVTPGSIFESAEIGRYVPGFSAEAGIGVLLEPEAEGEWGLFNDTDGFIFRYTIANGLQFIIRRNGIEIIASGDNLLDRLDGTDASGLNFDPTEGYVFQVDFTYYGFGPVLFSIMQRNGGLQSRMYPVAIMSSVSNTTIQNPNLYIRCDNTGGTGNVSVTGRQYSIIGPFTPQTRDTGATSNVITVTTSYTPIISFRRKLGSAFDIYSLLAEKLHVINGANDIEFQLILNASLTGAVPVLPDNRTAGETAIEFDKSAIAFTGGEMFFSDLLRGTGNQSSKIEDDVAQKVRIPRNYWVTLVAKTFTGTSDVRAHLVCKEEW